MLLRKVTSAWKVSFLPETFAKANGLHQWKFTWSHLCIIFLHLHPFLFFASAHWRAVAQINPQRPSTCNGPHIAQGARVHCFAGAKHTESCRFSQSAASPVKQCSISMRGKLWLVYVVAGWLCSKDMRNGIINLHRYKNNKKKKLQPPTDVWGRYCISSAAFMANRFFC